MSNDKHRIKAIDSGAALNKGVARPLREGQKPVKPAGLSRPTGVAVPPPPATDTQGNKK